MQKIKTAIACVAVLLTTLASSHPCLAEPFATIQPTLKTYCYTCHGDKPELEGELDLKAIDSKAKYLADPQLLAKMVESIESGEMPPEFVKQPTPEERAVLLAQFKQYVEQHLAQDDSLAPIVMRRLNRYEYNNVVRDLLGMKRDLYPIPEKTIRAYKPYFDLASGKFPDSVEVGNRTIGKHQMEEPILAGVTPFAIDLQAEHGFNNRGELLSVSPLLLESFLNLSQSIVNSPQFKANCGKYNEIFTLPSVDNAKAKEHPKSAVNTLDEANRRIAILLLRAFRRPPDETTLARYQAFFVTELKRTGSFEMAMKRVVSAIIASPSFLYIAEAKQTIETVRNLDDFELATRLSFFLWSSMPDDELYNLAAQGQLSNPKVLETQVRRLLKDRRTQSLSESFARQWLQLDRLISVQPDIKRFPFFYQRVGCEYWGFNIHMMLEPLLLFECILVEDRPIIELIDSNYSFRSKELEAWYVGKHGGKQGEFNAFQHHFKRRKLTTRKQGGVMTTAAIMTMNATPLRTHPIQRGAWVSTVVFNDPPKPPPAVVPEIEADDKAFEAQGLTIRQRLKPHSEKASCKSCHAKIDPLGFALENFDSVGLWREKYTSGLPIDAAGQLSGNQIFKDVVEFKDALIAKPEVFTKAFAEHMLSYALGRELRIGDQPAVDKIVAHVMANECKLSALIVAITQSRPFQHKTNQALPEKRTAPQGEHP